MSLVNKLAEYIVSEKYQKIPAEVIDTAKQCLLDTLGAAIYGTQFTASTIVSELSTDMGGKPEAVVWGSKVSLPAPLAAMVNGVSAHVADYDNSHVDFRGHPGAVIVPAVMAAGEKVKATGKDIITGIVVGVEVGTQIGIIIGQQHYDIGWHGTGTVGTIGVAAATAKVLGLDSKKAANALSIAASSASGIRENFGTMTKSWHAGHAASVGLMASLLAQKGYDASDKVFEGNNGFLKVFGGKPYDEEQELIFGKPYHIMNILFKQYPSCHGTHQAVDAVLKLRANNEIKPEDIEAIKCYSNPTTLTILIHHNPQVGLEAKFSMEYCVAASMVNGRLGLAELSDAKVADPVVRALMSKVSLLADEELDKLAQEKNALAPTRVEVYLKDGRVLRETVIKARGWAEEPLSWGQLESKFEENVQGFISPPRTRNIIKSIADIENIDDINNLASYLTKE